MPPLPLGPLLGMGAAALAALLVVLALRAAVRALSSKLRQIADRRRSRHS